MRPVELEGLGTEGDAQSWALYSSCGKYRYALGRTWDIDLPVFAATCLNPSTAGHDPKDDDRTLGKLLHYARQEKCGALLLRNIAAYRETKPKLMIAAPDPFGPRNLEVLRLQPMFAIRVAAWGVPPRARQVRYRFRDAAHLARMETTHVFGLTKDGHPRHPLYLPNATRITRWRDARSICTPTSNDET